MSMQTAWRRQRAKDKESVERYADQIMTDTRWDWLRSPRRRRVLVVAFAAMLTTTAALYILVGSWGSVALIGSILLWIALRLAVRTVADLPEELLDERQLALRDRAYMNSYIALCGLILAGVGVLLAWVLLTTREGTSAQLMVDDNDAFGVLWAALGFCVALPSMVIAWSETAV